MRMMTKRSIGLLSSLGFVLSIAQAQNWNFVARLNPALDDIVPADAKVEKLTDSFGFLEGPVWVSKGGYLLFSDIPANVIKKFIPVDRKLSVAFP